MAEIRFFDCFAGIGGFRSGLEKAGGFKCVGFCEIDKHAAKAYKAIFNAAEEVYFEDISRVRPADLPPFDLFVGGFPCQPFSICGHRRGFLDARGTLFYHIARILRGRQPPCVLLENVPGLLSHDNGNTFGTILRILSELGYSVEWRVFDSSCFGVPQQRHRVYIVGCLESRCAGKILSFPCYDGKSPYQVIGGSQGDRVYSADGTAVTQCAGSGGGGGRTGLYFIDMNAPPTFTDIARCLVARYTAGITNHKGVNSGVFVEGRMGENGVMEFIDRNGVVHIGRIRRLMPIESWRLQGFTDEQFERARAAGISEGQLYKMAGNAVTVPVVEAVGRKVRDIVFRGGEPNDTS